MPSLHDCSLSRRFARTRAGRIIEGMNADDSLDWISIKDACRLVPSPRGGHTHLSTIYRWIDRGKLEERRRGRWRFVRRSEVLALLVPRPRPAPQPRAADPSRLQAAEDRYLAEARRRHRLGRPAGADVAAPVPDPL